MNTSLSHKVSGKPNGKVNGKRIVQIVAIYLFALVAAVACGEGFVAKRGVQPIIKTKTVGPQIEFRPSFKKAVKSEAAESITINVTFQDGDNELTLATQHSKDALEANDEKTIGEISYRAHVGCGDETCTEIAFILARIDNRKTPAAVFQSAFLLTGKDATLLNANEIHNSQFEDANEAYGTLKASSRNP